MSITYTTPIQTPDLTVKRLVRFAASVIERRIVCMFEIGYLDGGGRFVKVGESRREFADDTVPSFADFLAACPAAANLRRQAEQYEVTLDAPGTVD